MTERELLDAIRDACRWADDVVDHHDHGVVDHHVGDGVDRDDGDGDDR